jgi:hypothetical protein
VLEQTRKVQTNTSNTPRDNQVTQTTNTSNTSMYRKQSATPPLPTASTGWPWSLEIELASQEAAWPMMLAALKAAE